MTDIVKVSTEDMRSAVTKFSSCKNELQNAYLLMSNAVRAVDSSWDGKASEAFKGQFNSMYKNIELTERKAQDAIDEITKAIGLFEGAESELASAFGGLDTGSNPFSG